MQIQLKQPEVEAALKMFISQQGISLVGKAVTIEFTSGRKNNGLTADLVIEDASIPGYTDTFVVHSVQTSNAPPKAVEAGPDVPNPGATDEATATKPISLFK